VPSGGNSATTLEGGYGVGPDFSIGKLTFVDMEFGGNAANYEKRKGSCWTWLFSCLKFRNGGNGLGLLMLFMLSLGSFRTILCMKGAVLLIMLAISESSAESADVLFCCG
jgi:hypothetical protein